MLNTKLNTVTAKKRFIGVPFELVIRFCFPVRYLRKLRSDGSTHRPPLSVRIPHGIMDGGMAHKDSRHADELWQRFVTYSEAGGSKVICEKILQGPGQVTSKFSRKYFSSPLPRCKSQIAATARRRVCYP